MNPKVVTTHVEHFLVQVCACGFLHILFQEPFVTLCEYRQATFIEYIVVCLWVLHNFSISEHEIAFQ